MEVGEYVRTNDGYIGRIKEIRRDQKRECDTYYCCDNHMAGGFYEHFVKHSKNPKDLIEEGDILRYRINNLSSIKIGEVRKCKDARSFKEYLGVKGFSLEQIEILKIVTKEQMKSIEYEV